MLAATTSIEDTGLLDVLAAAFTKDHPEIELSPISVGTGQALALGRQGDADVLISHDSAGETQLIADGIATQRSSLMQNDFIIAGPAEDSAHARGNDAASALRNIAQAHALFISRGDDSGTHRKEKQLWKLAGIAPAGAWYVEAGLGMGDALLLAGQKHAYILTDRGTYLRFRGRVGLEPLCEGDPHMLNRYAVTVIKGPHQKEAETFSDWMTSPATQKLIGDFGKADFGQPLFIPVAAKRTTRKS